MTKAEATGDPVAGGRRVYPLDARDLTEEQIAVAFAMTSRRPEPFDEIARQVSQEKAADFHERWVLGYGHASVAEHAVVHLAVENISRLACDGLEDNRLASYTEKSSRYQVIPSGDFYFPRELDAEPELAVRYNDACRGLFATYREIIDRSIDHLRRVHPMRERERESGYNLRLRRIATDGCRALLPASTLTNVGVTANARVLEHAVSKLMSSELDEERELGLEIRRQGRNIAPTLIKYADSNPYLAGMPGAQRDMTASHLSGSAGGALDTEQGSVTWQVKLVDWDRRAEEKLAAALLYRYSDEPFDQVQRQVELMTPEGRLEIIDRSFAGLGDHDAPARRVRTGGLHLRVHPRLRGLPGTETAQDDVPPTPAVDRRPRLPGAGPAGRGGPRKRVPTGRGPVRLGFPGGARRLALDCTVPGDPRPLPPAFVQDEPAGVLSSIQAADVGPGPLCRQGPDAGRYEAGRRRASGVVPAPASEGLSPLVAIPAARIGYPS